MCFIACTVSEHSYQLVHKRSLILVSSVCMNNLLILWSFGGSDQTVGDALAYLIWLFAHSYKTPFLYGIISI